jgi:D-alanyl-D-alanine carboxypeptidase
MVILRDKNLKAMTREKTIEKIEREFRKKVQTHKLVNNAYLMVHCDRLDMHLKLAEGQTGFLVAHPDQPNYMASVGKLFTSALTAILYDNGELSFNDPIGKFLEPQLMKSLHVYKGKDYSEEIQIRHLLNHTSGLPDSFWPLLERVVKEPDFNITPQQALEWATTHAKPAFAPGKGFKYTDTNYHLLGLIIEKITGMEFHDALRFYFFEPLGMKNTWMHHRSEPSEPSPYPMADFCWKKTRMNDFKAYAGLDYAGGGVVATMEDLLKFMQALVKYKLVTPETLETMKSDTARFHTGIRYGYGIWMFDAIPFLLPEKYHSWGVAGATGAFLFYHPQTQTYIAGNFNDTSWMSKGLQFMIFDVIKPLLKTAI